MGALKVRGLDFFYGARHILRNIRFVVEPGEFFMIIGPNGSGKTSLLKALAGLSRAEQGKIVLLGRALDRYGRRELARIVAVVPQQAPGDFPFNVAETVLMGRSPHLGLLGVEQQADYDLAEEAMRFTDVLHLAGRCLEQLSGGERQRVAIARAICQHPKLILLDEPTASLDPAHQIYILDLLERFRRDREITVVMVSHDLNLAAMYGDRLLLLKNGAVETVGSPGKVLTRKRLEKSYGCALQVDENPLAKVPRVLPVPGKYRQGDGTGI